MEISAALGELTEGEREILADGRPINYYAKSLSKAFFRIFGAAEKRRDPLLGSRK